MIKKLEELNTELYEELKKHCDTCKKGWRVDMQMRIDDGENPCENCTTRGVLQKAEGMED